MKFHEYFPCGLGDEPDTKQAFTLHGILARVLPQETNLPELSSLFATHCLDMIKPSVEFHEYIPYGL